MGTDMGGLGSGRTGGYPSIERTDSIILDVNRLMRAVRRNPDASWRWIYGDNGALGWLEARVSPPDDPLGRRAFLRYDIDHISAPTGERAQTVRLVSRPCHFGGERWFFLCPSSGRRCSKLLLPNGTLQFYSRVTLRLAYDVTRETDLDRAHRRLARLYRKLGQPYEGPDPQSVTRPRYMRRRTFEAIVARIQDEVRALDEAFVARWAHLIR